MVLCLAALAIWKDLKQEKTDHDKHKFLETGVSLHLNTNWYVLVHTVTDAVAPKGMISCISHGPNRGHWPVGRPRAAALAHPHHSLAPSPGVCEVQGHEPRSSGCEHDTAEWPQDGAWEGPGLPTPLASDKLWEA